MYAPYTRDGWVENVAHTLDVRHLFFFFTSCNDLAWVKYVYIYEPPSSSSSLRQPVDVLCFSARMLSSHSCVYVYMCVCCIHTSDSRARLGTYSYTLWWLAWWSFFGLCCVYVLLLLIYVRHDVYYTWELKAWLILERTCFYWLKTSCVCAICCQHFSCV